MNVGGLVLVTVVTLASGWLGVGLNRLLGFPDSMDSPGTLLWLVTPMLLVLGMRLAHRVKAPGRWAPRVAESWPWYVVALVIYPVVCLVSIAAGVVTGGGSVDTLRFGALGVAFASTLVPQLVKNVFEEAVWRGYFVGGLAARRCGDPVVYRVSGGVWGLWYLPSHLYFLPEEQTRSVMDVPRGLFALAACAVMMLWGVLFAELFRLARSIWPLVLAHAVEDAAVNPLVFDGHLEIQPGVVVTLTGKRPLPVAGSGLFPDKVCPDLPDLSRSPAPASPAAGRPPKQRRRMPPRTLRRSRSGPRRTPGTAPATGQ